MPCVLILLMISLNKKLKGFLPSQVGALPDQVPLVLDPPPAHDRTSSPPFNPNPESQM